jgi:hypothetical protein
VEVLEAGDKGRQLDDLGADLGQSNRALLAVLRCCPVEAALAPDFLIACRGERELEPFNVTGNRRRRTHRLRTIGGHQVSFRIDRTHGS